MLTLNCTGCQVSMPYGRPDLRCPKCGEPLEVRGYIKPEVRPGAWSSQSMVERYIEFLPLQSTAPHYRSVKGSLRCWMRPHLRTNSAWPRFC